MTMNIHMNVQFISIKKWCKTAGNNKISSKSNKTNSATIIKKDELSRTLDFNLSNPDSKTVNWGSLKREKEDNKNWTQVNSKIIQKTIIIVTKTMIWKN